MARKPHAVDAEATDGAALLGAVRAGRTRAGGSRTPVHRYLGKVAESVGIRARGVTPR